MRNVYQQVLDPISGWCEIRPYNEDVWRFLRAAFKCSFFLLSATVDNDSLDRILGAFIRKQNKLFTTDYSLDTLEILREDLSILFQQPDRPNIFSQRRILKKKIDVM